MNLKLRTVLPIVAFLFLAACARQVPEAVSHGADVPSFWWGMWHGFIFPWAWIGSLFNPDIAVYAVPNTGGWYDFGFFLGITMLGGGSFFGSKRRRRD
ncbi:MAG TPA: LPXTG cell wall anchor domain-containing protein [Sphingomonadaceae bacterium]|nr:LPXTG cell wall anchor domain-containing protein [Sphingomonadaceae bacterium]